MSDRKGYLLRKAAEAFGEGIDPFNSDWLTDHQVTADECIDLSSNLGVVVLGYLALPDDVKQRTHLMGAAIAAGVPLDVVEAADDHLRLRQLTDQLKGRRGG